VQSSSGWTRPFLPEQLRATDTATSVRVRAGERLLTDGPFVETIRAGLHHAAGLRSAHRRPHIVLGENPLHRDGFRTVSVHPVFRGVGNVQQANRQVDVGRGPDHVDRNTADRAARSAVDHAEPAPGQTGVDPEYPHALLLAEHQFEESGYRAPGRVPARLAGPCRIDRCQIPGDRRVARP